MNDQKELGDNNSERNKDQIDTDKDLMNQNELGISILPENKESSNDKDLMNQNELGINDLDQNKD